MLALLKCITKQTLAYIELQNILVEGIHKDRVQPLTLDRTTDEEVLQNMEKEGGC